MPRRLVSPTLVGRTIELEAVARALDSAVTGTPIHQLIAGEAGVGKSRLVLAASEMAAARGMRVLQGGCADIGDGGVPYGPIVEALRTLARSIDPAELDTILGTARPELARLVPSLGQAAVALTHTQTESHQARLLDAVLGLLQRLSEIAPVLFVIEDLHWADPATRETIAFLIRHLRTDRVVLLMTFRADELHRRHPLLPWLAELERSGRVDRLDLRRLDPAETEALLTAILGAPPTGELADQIHRRSDGNPFFVEELLGAGEDAADGRLPPTLREVLLARIVALPEPAQAVIGVAAVAGRRVDHDLLARVAAMSGADLLDALRTAVGSQVLVTGSAGGSATGSDDGDYAFRHALLQKRPTTISCRASDSASTARSPRRSPSGDRGAAPSQPATGPSSRSTGRPPATTAARSRHRSGPARPRPPRSPSPTPDARMNGHSSSGHRSTAPRTWPASIASPCSTGPRWPPGCRVMLAGRSSCAARRSRPSAPMPTRSGRGRCSNSSVGRCGPAARPRRP